MADYELHAGINDTTYMQDLRIEDYQLDRLLNTNNVRRQLLLLSIYKLYEVNIYDASSMF